MKIAVIHNLPSGGAKVVLYWFVKILKNNHLIDEYCLSTSERKFYNLSEMVNKTYIFSYTQTKKFKTILWRFNFVLNFLDLFRLNRIYKEIAKKVDVEGYDVVLMTHDRFIQTPSCLRYLKTPTLYYCHEPFSKFYRKHKKESIRKLTLPSFSQLYDKTLKWIDKSNIKFAQKILVNSKNTKENCKKAYGIESKVCYQGVNTDIFRPLNNVGTNSIRAIEEENFVLSVGALDPVKGHDFIIRALGKIDKEIRPSLKIVYERTTEGYKEHLSKFAKKQDVRVHFLCRISSGELINLYNKAKFLICAQYNEPFGRTPLEAMACEIPVIAVNEGGFKETILHKKTGLLVKRDINELCNAINMLLCSPKKRKEYGKNGRKYILDNWTWESAAKKLETYLYQVSEGGKGV
ncbi:glycosyltransferase family 4 protein [candidate division WOR-3 bacterium]|nr:glycosyltransferase family 4 protein [candidate division WOR-3 bacterium]